MSKAQCTMLNPWHPQLGHTVRYYGWYSSKSRGMRKKTEAETSPKSTNPGNTSTVTSTRCSQTWAMLIKRVYENDPMVCTRCGGEMEVISFIDPPQSEVIEKILRHCGLWKASAPRGPPDPVDMDHDPDSVLLDCDAELTV
ncbi:MAG: hypothetical protein ABGX16_15990, partial [Pirellulales bacterium]